MSGPVAYLRKSRVIDESRDVSHEVQEGKVRELAATFGDNGSRLLILSDWNISGRKGTNGRPGYRRLVEMIEGGDVSALYSYSLSRLSRSVQDLRALMALADAHGVPVRLVADRVDTSSATGRLLFTVLAAVDEMTADLASEHARDAVAARRARGDKIGRPYGDKPGEDPAAVVTAYRDAGSVLGAARLLNEREVPTRMGRPWASVTVRETLIRLGAMEHHTRPGAKARAPFAFYGLLRCHCGHLLTGARGANGRNPAYVTYKCHFNRTVPNHGPGSIPETRILAWAKAEAALLRLPESVEMEAESRERERQELTARRARILDMFEMGAIDRAAFDARIAAVIEAETVLSDQEHAASVVTVPELDWTWAPEAINAVLRALWSEITFDATMTPIGATWIVPEWRDGV